MRAPAKGGYMRGQAAVTEAATRAATAGGRWSDQEDGGAVWQTPSGATTRIPGKSIASGHLGVSPEISATGQGQLDVGRQNSALGQARFSWDVAGQPGARKTGSVPSPNAQKTAKEMALDQLATMPKLKGYLTNANGYWEQRTDLTPIEKQTL